MRPVKRSRPISANCSHTQRSGNNASNTVNHTLLDPAHSGSAKLIRYFKNPQMARGQRAYMDLLRGSICGTRSSMYSIEIIEDWAPWKVAVAGAVPVLGSVAGTTTWYYFGYGGGLMAFQIGILIAILGWGVVGVLVLLS